MILIPIKLSCLGPILFVIFINDMPDAVQSICQIYADDSKLFSEVNDEISKGKLQEDLVNVMDWADQWQMRFNAEKCHIVHLGKNNPNYTYYMRNEDRTEDIELSTFLM